MVELKQDNKAWDCPANDTNDPSIIHGNDAAASPEDNLKVFKN
jgi:hypothetical protein